MAPFQNQPMEQLAHLVRVPPPSLYLKHLHWGIHPRGAGVAPC